MPRQGFWTAPLLLLDVLRLLSHLPGSSLISQPPHGDGEVGCLSHSQDFPRELGFPRHLWKLLWGLLVPSDLTFHDDVALWVFLHPLCWELVGLSQSAKLCLLGIF